MVSVKCKACGKRYDYYEHGCCPNCGAYNRPPQRDRVDADGTVHHLSDADFLNNTEKRRRSQGGKVCFERDECHEAQPRKVRRSPEVGGESYSPFTTLRQSKGGKKKSPGRIVAGVIVAVMIANILPLLLTMCSVSDVWEDISGEVFDVEVGHEQARPEPLPDGETEYTADLGDTFIWWDNDAAVVDVAMDEQDGYAWVELTMWRTEAYDEPVIFYDTVDGWQEKAGCENVSQLEDELYIYHYTLEAWDPEGECYAFFDGYNGNVHCEVKVPLTMQLEDAPSVELSYLPMEQSFLWNDGACTVVGAEILEDGSMTEVQIAVVQDESFEDPTLCYISEFDGMEYTAYCEDCQDLGSGMFSYGFYVLDRMPGSDCWACFSGDNDGAPYEVRVLLENTEASEEGPAERGEWFTVGGEEVMVQDVVLEEKGNTLNLQVFVERDDRFGTMPILCYVTTDGQRETAACQSYIAREDGNVSYRYKVKNVDTDRGMSLRFTDSLGLTPAVTVPLN